MAHKRVRLRRGGGLPTVEMHFGQLQFAKYDILLHDRNGADPRDVVRNKTFSDGDPDVFTVGSNLEDLDFRILRWQGVISVLDNRPDQTYLMRAIVRQGDAVLGTFDRSGPIANTAFDEDTVRFVLEQP